MSWLALEVPIHRRELEAIEDILMGLDAVAITLVAEDDQPGEAVLEPDPGATPLWEQMRLQALFALDTDIAALRRGIDRFNSALFERIEIGFLQDQDWQRVMQQNAVEAEFAGRLRLLPKAKIGAKAKPNRVDMYLDPGLAFGTGSHPTTRMCLHSVAELARPNMRILDFGCGSGILGVAGALLGAVVECVDHDEQALLATRENAHYNGLNRQPGNDQLCVMGLAQWRVQRPINRYEMVLANILAGPLMQLAIPLAEALKQDGTLVLSGILPEQSREVIACYPTIDFQTPYEDTGWIRLTGRKRGE